MCGNLCGSPRPTFAVSASAVPLWQVPRGPWSGASWAEVSAAARLRGNASRLARAAAGSPERLRSCWNSVPRWTEAVPQLFSTGAYPPGGWQNSSWTRPESARAREQDGSRSLSVTESWKWFHCSRFSLSSRVPCYLTPANACGMVVRRFHRRTVVSGRRAGPVQSVREGFIVIIFHSNVTAFSSWGPLPRDR